MTQPDKPSFRVPRWAYNTIDRWLRWAYRLTLEGVETLPQHGPVILLPTDIQGLLGPLVQMLALSPVMKAMRDTGLRYVSFLHEILFALLAKRMSSKRSAIYGVRPHDAGTQGLSLIDGYRALQEGGLVNINPEGDQSWDGAGVGIKPGCAWLALRTAAPCVLVVPTAGLYDAWPFWQRFPSLTGRITVRYSEPFTVTDQPLDRVTDEDLAQAKAIIGARLDALRYGPEGVQGWAAPPRLNGKPLEKLPNLRRPRQPRRTRYRKVRAIKQGIGLLLFQCPICGATDSVVHRHNPIGADRVVCRACQAKWHVKREVGKDYRLTLKRGPADLLGLDVALSHLHAFVKEHMQLDPAPVEPIIELADNERSLLVANKCKVSPYDSGLIQSAPAAGLAPTSRTEEHLIAPSQETLGVGRLAMTDRRLVWQSDSHLLEFEWAKVNALHIYFRNVMVVAHGAALYTMNLGDEGAIKWIAYADRIVNSNGHAAARKVPVSPY